MAFEVLEREEVYHGRVFDVHKELVRMPDGRPVQIDVVFHHGAVTLVPLDDQGNILFVRQYRHPAGREILELPAGVVEPGEEAEAAAGREIREETGMAAAGLQHLGSFFLAPGYSTERMDVFLSTGLYPDPLQADDDEDLQVEKIPARRALQLAEGGAIEDAKTLAALFLARARLLAT